MPSPTGATPALDKGTVGIVLASGAKQAATANPRVLGPGVRGEAGCSHEAPLQAKPGIKVPHHSKSASTSSSSCHQRADANRDPATKENRHQCTAMNKSKRGIQCKALLMSRRKTRAPSQEDTTERRLTALKGTVPKTNTWPLAIEN